MEAALSIYLENFATTLGSREQLAIAEVADALLVIPKCLAVNAAKDATELVRPFVGSMHIRRTCFSVILGFGTADGKAASSRLCLC